MFNGIRMQRRIGKLQRERNKKLERLSERLSNAEWLDSEMAEHIVIVSEYQEKIDAVITSSLVDALVRYMLPIPNDDVSFYKTKKGSRYLTRTGATQVRSLIREYEKQEREGIAFWISSVVGVLGALSGVIGLLIAYAALK